MNKQTVAQTSDLKPGTMLAVTAGDTPLLLSQVGDTVYATGAKCTHNGANLAKGVLCDRRVVCPWHNASFDVTTGDQICPPGLDSLPSYAVNIEGNDIIVQLPDEPQPSRTRPMARHNSDGDGRTFVILGAGAAGTNAAEALRVLGFEGRLIMITAEDELPYDRTMLSKQYLSGDASAEALPLRSPEFYQAHDIDVKVGSRVTEVLAQEKQLTFDDGATLAYDALLLATGGKAKLPPLDGVELDGVYKLHNQQQAEAITKAAKDAKRAVVAGASFIGMETAASLTQQGIAVTVISPGEVPFETLLGPEVGRLFQRVHEANGVTFELGTKLAQVKGTGHVESVVAENGLSFPAELVVMGIGVQPATDYIQQLELDSEDKSVPVDEYLNAGYSLYAAGDIATFPDWRTGENVRIEHWQLAAQQGRVAARNMLGQKTPFRGVPFFWTGQFDLKLRYVGHASDWDEVITEGNLEDIDNPEFLAFYRQGDRILAVAGINRDAEIAAISELMRLDQMPGPDAVRSKVDWLAELALVK
ncbi:MAG: FAD-dependent oxidoreductase [Elainellaceae cyanobacterium]